MGGTGLRHRRGGAIWEAQEGRCMRGGAGVEAQGSQDGEVQGAQEGGAGEGTGGEVQEGRHGRGGV